MNITRINAPLLPAWWGVWIALMLLVFGLPALTARLILLPGDPVREDLLEGKPVAEEDLATLESSRKSVVGWFSLGALYNDLAVVAMERANHAANPQEAAPLYREAVFWQQKALAVSPADPYGWFRQTYLSYVYNNDLKASGQAWALSMASAPYEPRLQLARLQMGLKLGKAVSAEAQSYLPRMVREVWRSEPKALIQAAKAGTFISVVEGALADDASALEAFRADVSLNAEKKAQDRAEPESETEE